MGGVAMGGRRQEDNKARWRWAEPGLTRQRRLQVMTRWNVLDKFKKIHGRWNKKVPTQQYLEVR
jgi:hypothetical protein